MREKFLIIFLVSFFLSGCVPNIGGPSGNTPGNLGEFTKGRAVANFPNLPRYPKAKILESIGNNGSFGAAFYTKDELAKVIKFYSESLPALGWESQLIQKDESHYYFEVKNAQYEGQILINPVADGGSVAITVSVESR